LQYARHAAVTPTPEINQLVEVTFIAVAIPFAASSIEPVSVLFASVSVSVVIAMVKVFIPFINVTAVPTGNATLELAGIVKVLALSSAAE
jgi:hypothetical protein